MLRNKAGPKKSADKINQTNNVTMVIKIVAKCTQCGTRETLYVAEDCPDVFKRHCKNCGNEEYSVTYR